MKLTAALRLTAITTFCILFAQGALWANPLPLGKVPVPEPANLSQFVKSKEAAVRLGKALFWDMQAGSDGVQACASCHFSAGADNRLTNQLHPGVALPQAALPAFEFGGLNYTQLPADFPFFQVSPVDGRLGLDPLTGLPEDPDAVILRNFNEIGGSQGIRLADFLAINAGSALESGSARLSPLFAGSRQVTGRNAPSVINAVFNYTNFWDGRAHNSFNGENPLGPLDLNAGIWMDDGTASDLVKQRVVITNASLASQATGPPLSDVEMSFAGRTFPDLARKMLGLTPLGQQLVHPGDSVLGPLARASLQSDGSLSGAPGLDVSYRELIEEAFQDNLWASGKTVTLQGGAKSQLEANFPLFWGLALQLYQATLVSDQTPFDRFLAGNADAMSPSAQAGFLTFVDKCAVCHAGSELTNAVVGSNTPFCLPPDCNRAAFGNNSSHALIAPDINQETFELRLADAGFFNIGVRATAEDPGRGAGVAEGFPFPLSFTRLAQFQGLPFVTPKLPAGTSGLTPVALDGAFKTPGLRNIELTAPYFHNGSMLTLDEVIEFYTRGGNFPGTPELASAMQPIRNLRDSPRKKQELVDFMKALTDERVRNQTAPFDHPQLLIASGDLAESMIDLSATGGAPVPLAPALTVDPLPTPTVLTTLTLSGTVASLSTVEVRVNSLPSVFATVTGTSWSVALSGLPVGINTVSLTASSASGGSETRSEVLTVLPLAVIRGIPPGGSTSQTGAVLTVSGSSVASYRYSLDAAPFSADTPVGTQVVLSGLTDGTHTVQVLGMDAAGNRQPQASATSASWTVKATPPLLTLDQLASPTRVNSQTIGGRVELGSVPSVTVSTAAQVGAVKTIGGEGSASWSCTISGLVEGENNFTVTARDFVFNTSTLTGVLTLDTVAPALTLDAVASPARGAARTLTGTVEAGIVPQVQMGSAAEAGPVTVSGTSWSCLLSGLLPGANEITVTALDQAGNLNTRSAALQIVVPDGNFKGTGVSEISDALLALRIAVGLTHPSPLEFLHGNVAPLANGVPDPDDKIDISDALAILRKVVGLLSF